MAGVFVFAMSRHEKERLKLRYCGEDGALRAELAKEDGLCVFRFFEGEALLICSERFCERVPEAEMLVDLCKSESAREWGELLLLRFVESTGTAQDCSLLACMAKGDTESGLR